MNTKALLLSSAIALTAASALAAVVQGDVVGISKTEIRAQLESKGYTVQSIEVEGGEIEVEALLNGVEMEIEISSSTGAILEVEVESDDDDKDDDD